MAKQETILTSGTLAYAGEEGYTAPGVSSGGNRPVLLPRNGVVKGIVIDAHLAPGKEAGSGVINLVTKTSLTPFDDKDPITEGTVVNSWDMISGAYSDKAKKAGQPRVHVLRDYLIACGMKEAAVIKLIPVGKGKVDFGKIAPLLAKLKGRTVYANVLDEEGTKKYKGQYTSSVTSWANPEEVKKTVPVAGYGNPLRPAAQRYFDNPEASAKTDDGFDVEDDAALDDDDAVAEDEAEVEEAAAPDADDDGFFDEE